MINQTIKHLVLDPQLLNDGLDYGNGNYPYGTRVQDHTISLNVPDVIEIHGVFESADTNNATAPKVTLSDINSTSTTTAELLDWRSLSLVKQQELRQLLQKN